MDTPLDLLWRILNGRNGILVKRMEGVTVGGRDIAVEVVAAVGDVVAVAVGVVEDIVEMVGGVGRGTGGLRVDRGTTRTLS